MRRSLAVAILSLLSILPVSLLAQQGKQLPAPVRDPQAVSILTQSISVAGGAQALNAVRDFTATGKITYYWTEKGDTGTVTVKSRGMNQFRLDATLSDGVMTSIVNNGVARTKDTNGSTRQLTNQHTYNVGCLYFPFAEIVAALSDPSISIVDLGTATENGQQVHGIRLQKIFADLDDSEHTRAKLTQRDVFIDPVTFLVLRTRDLAPTRSGPVPSVIHDVAFSNYQPLNGVLFPFSITESLNHQRLNGMQFDSVKLNGGLGDGDFQ